MAKAIECDQDGNPRIYYAVGVDPTDPNKVVPVIHEIRPGGMVTVKAVPGRRVTVAPDPAPPPSLEEVEEERMERARAAVERERGVIEEERAPEGGGDEEEAENEAARDSAARKAGRRPAAAGGRTKAS